MFQDYAAYQLSAGENIGVGNVDTVDDPAAIGAAAERAGADAVIAKLPEGYDTTLGKWFEEGTNCRAANGKRWRWDGRSCVTPRS